MLRIRPAEESEVPEVARVWRAGWTDLGDVTLAARPRHADGEPIPVLVRHYVKQLR